MEAALKIKFLLFALYEKKYNGKFYDVEELFASNKIAVSRSEATEILETLANDGFIKTLLLGDYLYSQITVDGVEYLEENNFFSESSYIPRDIIKPLEREVLKIHLDELPLIISQAGIGYSLSEEDIAQEINELKCLLYILGKRSWIQIFRGKFYELGQQKVSVEEVDLLLDSIEGKPLTEKLRSLEYSI